MGEPYSECEVVESEAAAVHVDLVASAIEDESYHGDTETRRHGDTEKTRAANRSKQREQRKSADGECHRKGCGPKVCIPLLMSSLCSLCLLLLKCLSHFCPVLLRDSVSPCLRVSVVRSASRMTRRFLFLLLASTSSDTSRAPSCLLRQFLISPQNPTRTEVSTPSGHRLVRSDVSTRSDIVRFGRNHPFLVDIHRRVP
jgi:hypothetical protein